jgi:hypothetical protein
MEYMESRMQDQMEAGFKRQEELERQYDYFCEWYFNIPDSDESLVNKCYLDERYELNSPVEIVSAMWLGWRSAHGL